MHRNIILFIVVFLTSFGVFAQSGTLKGKVSDAMTGETIPMANIVIKLDGATVIGGASDFDGNYTIKVDISSLVLPDTFAEDKGATFTGIIRVVDGEFILEAEKVQMGCPSKYEPAEE